MKGIIFVILFLISCASADKVEFDPYQPDRKTGCSTVKGSPYFECVKNLLKNWEEIESAQPVETVLLESREGDFLVRKMKVCYSEHFCRPFTRKIYSPSIWSKVKEYAILILIGSLMGAGATNR